MPRHRRAVLATAALLAAVPATASAAAPVAPDRLVPGQVVVKFAEGTSAVEQTALLRARRLVRIGTVRALDALVVYTPRNMGAVADALETSPLVEYAEVNRVLGITQAARAVPNDPRFGELYGLDDPQDDDLDAPEAWSLAGLSAFPATGGVKVGIVDTGIRRTHEDVGEVVM